MRLAAAVKEEIEAPSEAPPAASDASLPRLGRVLLDCIARGGEASIAWRRRILARAGLAGVLDLFPGVARIMIDGRGFRFAEDGVPALILPDRLSLFELADLAAIPANFKDAASLAGSALFGDVHPAEDRLHLFASPAAWLAASAGRKRRCLALAAEQARTIGGKAPTFDGHHAGRLVIDSDAIDYGELLYGPWREIRCETEDLGERVYRGLRRAGRPKYPRVTAGAWAPAGEDGEHE